MRDEIVRIGHQGDNHAFVWSHSVKDILHKYGYGGEFSCRIRRSGDVDAYPKECVLEGDTLKVIFNTTDMQFVGIGELQYEYSFHNARPYKSLYYISDYLYGIVFDSLPNPSGWSMPFGACSSFVKDGKLYRNLDWDYDNTVSFKVQCPGFCGMAFLPGMDATKFTDERLAQLPLNLVDGVNQYGIKVATHILYNDWNYTSNGNIPLSRIPYLVLSTLESMDDIHDLEPILADLDVPSYLAEIGYLAQYIVTDGTTTYIIAPPESSTGSYVLIDATENPKLTNFRWVEDENIVLYDNLQTRPTGIERWNLIANGTTLEDLKFTNAYRTSVRLSEFIGIDGTTKDSTQEELEAIYHKANAEFVNRKRDGKTWQSMHSVVYGDDFFEHLYVQEDFEHDYAHGVLSYEMLKGVVKCSEVFKFMVERSLGEGDAPIPWIGWIQKVEQNARDAKDAADRSQEFAESVINLTVAAEEIPAGEQITVTKSISDKVINLLFKIPKAVFPQLFPWADITGKPSEYPPSEHNHNELYYGKSYIDDHTEDDVVHTSYEEKRQWNSAVWNKHTHANKTVLDSITQALIDKINGMYSKEYIDRHIGNETVHTNDSERAKWNRASQDRHTHPNKLMLDSIPAAPTDDGEYVLKCTVVNRQATVKWIRV